MIVSDGTIIEYGYEQTPYGIIWKPLLDEMMTGRWSIKEGKLSIEIIEKRPKFFGGFKEETRWVNENQIRITEITIFQC